MRITGGQLRGRVLNSPDSMVIRPTSDKVRQAIFNMLESRGGVRDSVVLDAFCGTGSLGLEALSRGAKQAIFTDNDSKSLALAKKNAETLVQKQNCFFYKMNASIPKERPSECLPANLLFCDPPYNKNLAEEAIPNLLAKGWLAKNALMVVETEKNYFGEPLPGLSQRLQEKIYGDTKIIISELLE